MNRILSRDTAVYVLCVVVTFVLSTMRQACANDEDTGAHYKFVDVNAENKFDRQICFGLAAAIERLQEASEIDGTESSATLALRKDLQSYLRDIGTRNYRKEHMPSF